MAERRMFAKSIIGSARFLRMPPSSRLLYYDLGMYADDDGVVEAFSVMRQTGATEDDLRVLVSKGFVKVLNDDLVSYIMDWNVNNSIRKDRYHPSIYKDLVLQLTGGQPTDNQLTTNGIPRLGKDRLGKVSIGENRLDEDSIDKSRSNNVVDFMELLTHDEIEYLKSIYEDVYDLMDEAGSDATKKRKKIGEPFAYLVGYATNKGWAEK